MKNTQSESTRFDPLVYLFGVFVLLGSPTVSLFIAGSFGHVSKNGPPLREVVETVRVGGCVFVLDPNKE